jgi:CRP-like cAMP-binding protein
MNYTTFTHLSPTRNEILSRLDDAERQRFPYLFRRVDLESQQTLYAPGDEIRHVYFPIGCVATAVAVMDDGATVETAMIGREGVVGIAAITGSYPARNWMRVLLPGDALRAEASAMRELFDENHLWQKTLLRYYCTLIEQVSRRAICNSRHRLSERLCTWLLMVHNRAGKADFPLTQEAIARQLGVRRAGINECIGWLERTKVVAHRRGHILILHREALEDAACACYPAFASDMHWFDDVKSNKGGLGDGHIQTRSGGGQPGVASYGNQRDVPQAEDEARA